MMGFGPAEMLLLLILSPLGGLPVGLPPAPADAGIERLAPEQCLYWLSWNGASRPDAKSENQAEQLLAEKEVQQFAQKIVQQVDKLAANRDGATAPQIVMSRELPYLLKTLLARPTVVLVEKVDLTGEIPQVTGGLVVNAGEEAKSLQVSLSQVMTAGGTPAVATRLAERTIAGVKTWRVTDVPEAAAPVWGFKDGYLVLGVGAASFETLVKRLSETNRPAPPWLSTLKKRLPTGRISTLAHAEVGAFLKIVSAKANEPQLTTVLEALGLSSIATIESVSGFDREDILTRSIIDCGGEPTGLLGLVKNAPLEAADLRTIPASAASAVALRLAPADIYQFALKTAARIDPANAEQIDRQIEQAQAQLGIKLQEDLLQPLGDVITLFSASEAGPAGSGIGATISLRDRDRLAKTHATLLALAKQLLAQAAGPDAPKLTTSSYKNHEILSVESNQLTYSPSWSLTKTHLVIGLSPESVQSTIDQLAATKSLAQAGDVAAVLERKPAAEVLLYADFATALENNYGMLLFGATMANQGLSQSGVKFQIPKLPALTALKPHLRPSIAKVARFKSGWLMERRQTVPLTGDLTSIAVALLLPAVQAAREAARRNQAMNNLKQIELAMHNHHDVAKGFPAAAIVSKDGKPLLSWRVKILPYIEQQALYKEFHLDEPWDSEHNAKLLPRMPQVFALPGKAPLAPGLTPYLAIVGEHAIIAPTKLRSVREIPDGTSMTIMTVEARPDRAVPWTKPEDLPLDEKTPAALLGARESGFLAGFGDGSVHFIDGAIDGQMLKALLTRDGGELVNLDAARP